MHQPIKVLDRSSQHAAGEDCSVGRYTIKLAPPFDFFGIKTEIKQIYELLRSNGYLRF
jgi:hypothetical protein